MQVVMTGATSGIGRATVERLARDGTRILAVGRDEARARACVDAVKAAGGEATLNLEQLETRVRDTPAIGFFTKLQLKGEIDDLLEEMERFHQSDSELVLDDLQSRYELLFLKLLTLLQDDDPDLHQDVAAARGEIWAILADPERFQEARHGSVS